MRHVSLSAVLLLSPLAAQTATYAVFTQLNPSPAPAARDHALMAHDEARNRTLLAGGKIGGNTQQQTWEFDGAAWTQVLPTTQLNFGKPTRMVYSPQLGQIVAVTGEDVSGGYPMVVHAWTGSNWLTLNANGPPSRAYDYEIAWDASRGVLVMFGGGSLGADTWEWDGTAWSQRGNGGPVARTGHRIVYDAGRHLVVLTGGQALQGGFQSPDTWEWNGVYWLQRFGIMPPMTSTASVIVYDSTRQRVVLHGGYDNGNPVGGVFEYDGNAWTSVPTIDAPYGYVAGAGAYATSDARIVLFGGIVGSNLQGTSTIDFVTGTLAGSYPHHTGCAGPAGVPTIAAVGSARPVLGSNFPVHFGNLPNTPLALVIGAFGTSDQSWSGIPLPLDLTPFGFTSCSLFVDPSIFEPLANVGGAATWTLALPSNPALDGVEFFVQGLVMTPGFNPAGAVLSSSLRGVAGVL